VNGERCERARLNDGDEIQLGRLQLQVSLRD
jgi:pSer/pThr/pTyr-binding forkhead associated (FHA) protein